MSRPRLAPFLTGLALGALLGGAIGFAGYIIKDFGDGMGPQVCSDQAVRTRIEGYFKAPLPPTAGLLYFREEGFMDSSCHVGVSLAPQDAWTLLAAYTGRGRADFRPLENHASLAAPEATPLWNPAALKAPVFLEISKERSHEIIIYDEPTQRLLAHFSSS